MPIDSGAMLRSFAALIVEEPEVAESFLLAALYVRAVQTGDTPRGVAEALFKAVSASEAWPALCAALLAMSASEEEGGSG